MSDCLALIGVYNAQDFDNTAVIRELKKHSRRVRPGGNIVAITR